VLKETADDYPRLVTFSSKKRFWIQGFSSAHCDRVSALAHMEQAVRNACADQRDAPTYRMQTWLPCLH